MAVQLATEIHRRRLEQRRIAYENISAPCVMTCLIPTAIAVVFLAIGLSLFAYTNHFATFVLVALALVIFVFGLVAVCHRYGDIHLPRHGQTITAPDGRRLVVVQSGSAESSMHGLPAIDQAQAATLIDPVNAENRHYTLYTPPGGGSHANPSRTHTQASQGHHRRRTDTQPPQSHQQWRSNPSRSNRPEVNSGTRSTRFYPAYRPTTNRAVNLDTSGINLALSEGNHRSQQPRTYGRRGRGDNSPSRQTSGIILYPMVHQGSRSAARQHSRDSTNVPNRSTAAPPPSYDSVMPPSYNEALSKLGSL